MILRPSPNCVLVLCEPDWCRGPGAWTLLGIHWNRVDLIEDRPLTPGDLAYLDSFEIRWLTWKSWFPIFDAYTSKRK